MSEAKNDILPTKRNYDFFITNESQLMIHADQFLISPTVMRYREKYRELPGVFSHIIQAETVEEKIMQQPDDTLKAKEYGIIDLQKLKNSNGMTDIPSETIGAILDTINTELEYQMTIKKQIDAKKSPQTSAYLISARKESLKSLDALLQKNQETHVVENNFRGSLSWLRGIQQTLPVLANFGIKGKLLRDETIPNYETSFLNQQYVDSLFPNKKTRIDEEITDLG